MTAVVVVGAGPTGLMMAGELATAGVDVEILESRTTQDLAGTRARGFHARTIEILDQRGLAERFLAEGMTVQALSFADTPLEVADLPTRHPYTLALGQASVEQILLGWVEELGVPLRRGVEVTGFAQDDSGVDVRLADGGTVRTEYLVGADGGRSRVRKEAGIDFVGAEPSRSYLIAEVELAEEPQPGMRIDEVGVHAMNVTPDGTVGLVETERELHADAEPTLDELADALKAYYGTDLGVHSPRWMSRFTDAARQAAAYRHGRVLIAGDAAHTHPPTGGQGIGLGLQDAVNVGWKLAQVVQGVSPATLLDSYQAERHPATARVLKNVMVQASLQRRDPRTDAVRDTFTELLAEPDVRRRLAAMLTGLDVHHDLGEGHPLLGRRMPDVDLDTDDGPRRAFELLHDARHVLLDLTAAGVRAEVTDRVRHVRAHAAGTFELPVVGVVETPPAVLVRPDGHVTWVGGGTEAGLEDALRTWCRR